MPQIPKEDNPYVRNVYGNILDTYDNPSYNIKLYMMRESVAREFNEDTYFYTDQDDSNTPTELAQPSDIVVLAQTGTTGTQIDDVEIHSLQMTDKSVQQFVNFRIVEPGAANFLDQIQLTKAYLGYAENSADSTMYMEIRFQGYETDISVNDEGGKPAVIAGPYVFKLDFQTFTVSLSAQGTDYDCTALIHSTFAYRDDIFRIPQALTTNGATITEHVEDLEKALNEWHSDTTATHTVPDEIKFDLSLLVGTAAGGVNNSLDIISDESLLTSKEVGQTEDLNRFLNENYTLRTKIDQNTASDDNPIDEGATPEVIFDGDNLKIKEGTSLEEYFYILLSMNQEFYSKITRKGDIDNVDSTVKPEQAFVSWVKILPKVENIEFDPSRNVYAKRYTFRPVIYKSANPNIAVDEAEQNLTLEQKVARLNEYKAANALLKAYDYYFTGRNDQILDLDIRYDSGVSTMLPPKYGALGDTSITSSNKTTASVPSGSDQSTEGQVQSLADAKNSTNRENASDFLDFVENLTDLTEQSRLLTLVGDLTGRSPDEIAGVLTNQIERAAFLEDITREAARVLGDIPTNPSVLLDVVQQQEDPISGSTYTPQLSNFVYSEDFIDRTTLEELDASTIQQLGLIEINGPPEIKQRKQASKDVPSVTESATYKTDSTRNKLFGFVAAQHNSNIFLITLDMVLRGDPWYLGRRSDIINPSSEEMGNFMKDDNLFWLRLSAPQRFDFDTRDEDSPFNSGYWKYDGTSRTFSGIYRMQTAINRFSGGQYTVQLNAHKIGTIDEPLQEQNLNTTPPDDSDEFEQ